MKRRSPLAWLLCLGCLSAEERFPAELPNPCDSAPACPDDMAPVVDAESYTHSPGQLSLVGGACVCVDRYEASRGPADVARSEPERTPWVEVSYAAARAACAAAGKRLCSGREWTSACAGIPVRSYPYGPDFKPGICNTGSAPTPTGSHPSCEGQGLFDLSGNVAEWTGVATDGARCDPEVGCAVHGGSYAAEDFELACGYRAGLAETSTSSEIGFRCCADP